MGRVVIYFGCARLWPVGVVPLFPRIQIKGKTVPMKALGEVLQLMHSPGAAWPGRTAVFLWLRVTI